MKRLYNTYRYENIQSNYYQNEQGDEEALNGILKWYKSHFAEKDATFLVPLGALRAIRRLSALSNNRTFVRIFFFGTIFRNNFEKKEYFF